MDEADLDEGDEYEDDPNSGYSEMEKRE
jgi:hypothetical protein